MKMTLTAVNLVLLLCLLASPMLVLRFIHRTNIRYKFVTFLAIGLIFTALLSVLFAWWASASNLLMLEHLGYNIDGMNETEQYEKVLPQHVNEVRMLEVSSMGAGWPLKAIITFVFFVPYLFFVYVLHHLTVRKNPK